jgi:lipoprotein-anchoring transpeptidase ErfK/SrfK
MNKYTYVLIGLLAITFLNACENNPFKKKKVLSKDNYKDFKNDVLSDSSYSVSDSANIFDKNSFDPTADSIEEYLAKMENVMENDSAQIVKLGINDSGILSKQMHDDSAIVRRDTFTSDIKHITNEEIKALKYNLESFKLPDTLGRSKASCKQKLCKVWAHVSKARQRLFLYLDGALVDSFKVSTGDSKHETPSFDTKPNGLMFQKYTSKKYPGGNYNGLGNMPYVVFIRGGFGIHGTTVGNFKKLGTKASHGCIRLHPDNAKLFFELVKAAGSNDTWITVSEK